MKKYQLVQWLVNNVPFIDLNAQDSKSYNAALYMYQHNRVDLLKLLIEKGADTIMQNSEGYDALMLACMNNDEEIIQLFIDLDMIGISANSSLKNNHFYKDKNDILVWSAQYGSQDILKFLLSKGINVNTRDEYNNTALISASKAGKEEAVKLLLGCKNINIDAVNNGRLTALMYGCQMGHDKIVRLLLNAKADVNNKR